MENNNMKRLIINTLTAISFVITMISISSCGYSKTKVEVTGTKKDTAEKEEGLPVLSGQEGIAEVTAEQLKAVGIEQV